MNILVTGNGKSGSWQIRGAQLGKAIGATVNPDPKTVKGFDCVVLIKKNFHPVVRMAREAKVPLIYDIVDAWQSVIGSDRGRGAALSWLDGDLEIVKPTAVVVGTIEMLKDVEDTGAYAKVIYHHSRPDIAINPVREKVRAVGYEGSEKYLGWWRPVLEQECQKRGWKFIINPTALADLDIVVAVRDEEGYPAKRWKSNVKLANAQASGTPCILNREAGYKETASLGERWADDVIELRMALDEFASHDARRVSSSLLRGAAAKYSLSTIAEEYLAWLRGFKRAA
jgi:hypothetical protein